MSILYSFAPIADANASVLILGSMPGEASLLADEYYAHPRNHFWRVMGMLVGFASDLPYAEKVQALKAARIAVWDVLQTCTRRGSLDADIDKSSIVANDFQSFFAQQANITHVFFNGSAAEQVYRRKVLPFLKIYPVEYLRLPSTSPANASLSFEQKLDAWRAISICLRDSKPFQND